MIIKKSSTRTAGVSGKSCWQIEKKLSDGKYPLLYFQCRFSSGFIYLASDLSQMVGTWLCWKELKSFSYTVSHWLLLLAVLCEYGKGCGRKCKHQSTLKGKREHRNRSSGECYYALVVALQGSTYLFLTLKLCFLVWANTACLPVCLYIYIHFLFTLTRDGNASLQRTSCLYFHLLSPISLIL